MKIIWKKGYGDHPNYRIKVQCRHCRKIIRDLCDPGSYIGSEHQAFMELEIWCPECDSNDISRIVYTNEKKPRSKR